MGPFVPELQKGLKLSPRRRIPSRPNSARNTSVVPETSLGRNRCLIAPAGRKSAVVAPANPSPTPEQLPLTHGVWKTFFQLLAKNLRSGLLQFRLPMSD